jgi:competence protein ComEA
VPENRDNRPGKASGPFWLPRHADQLAVAVLVGASLLATAGWWLSQGGVQGRLLEVERAEPRTVSFQVDVNAAEWPELAQLPGIGQTLAERIVESRKQAGPYLDHEDLRRVRGIGPITMKRIRPYLRPLEGRTTVARK